MRDFMMSRDMFSTPEMREIWSEHATISAWLHVEKALATAQANLGVIPQEAAEAIWAVSTQGIDPDAMRQEMALVGRPIVGLVRQIREQIGPDLAPYAHHKSTTQDIMDTAASLQMKQGLGLLSKKIEQCRAALAALTEDHGDTTTMARTNSQHAIPMKFGTKLAVWTAELERRKEALEDASERGLNVQIGGAVGDLSQYGDLAVGGQVKQDVAAALRLNCIDPHWQNARDGMGDIVAAIGSLCATLCKISHNINLLASDDIAEVREGYEPGKGASSAMAHKHNQRGSEFGEAIARLGRQRCEEFGEVTLHEHERSGGAWIAEWMILPDAFLLSDRALSWLQATLTGLTIETEQMERSLKKAARSPEARLSRRPDAG